MRQNMYSAHKWNKRWTTRAVGVQKKEHMAGEEGVMEEGGGRRDWNGRQRDGG